MDHDNKGYEPESYWSEVAQRIDDREDANIIAGDDEPYYIYKREKLIEELDQIDIQGKSVLEVGSGPGGNLKYFSKRKPGRLVGADISQNMIDLATRNVGKDKAEFFKVDGKSLPFRDGEFDYVFTITVLQHNTDNTQFESMLSEVCRVSGDKVVLCEKVERTIKGDELCMGRPITHYAKLCAGHGFKLISAKILDIRVSYYMAGITRKVLNPGSREEGEALSPFSLRVQKALMPVTKGLDKIFKGNRDLAVMVFSR